TCPPMLMSRQSGNTRLFAVLRGVHILPSALITNAFTTRKLERRPAYTSERLFLPTTTSFSSTRSRYSSSACAALSMATVWHALTRYVTCIPESNNVDRNNAETFHIQISGE